MAITGLAARKLFFAAIGVGDNRGMAAKELTSRQKKILGWIVDGCAGDPPHEFYKNTARMLEGHKLVKISGHGDKWKAVATKRGERVYAGTEALVVNKKRRKNTAAKEPPVPSTLRKPKPTPKPDEPEVDLTPYMARIRHGIGESDLDVFTIVASAGEIRDFWLPAAAKLSRDRSWLEDGHVFDYAGSTYVYGQEKPRFKAAVISIEPMKLVGWREILRGDKRVAKYNKKAVEAFGYYKRQFSSDVQLRIKRVLHVLFTEIELNGGRIELETWYDSWSKEKVLRAVKLGFDFDLQDLKFRERYNRVQREPTQDEIDYHNRWHEGEKMRRFWEKIPNGQLVLEFRGMSARDSKKNSEAFADGIEAYFKWHQIREFWKKTDYEIAGRERALRAKQYEFAKPIAAKTVAKDFYFNALYQRSQELKKFEAVCSYLEYVKRIEPDSPWISWAEKYLDTFNPRDCITMPDPPALDIKAHAGLIEKIIDALGRDESTWADAFPDGEFHG